MITIGIILANIAHLIMAAIITNIFMKILENRFKIATKYSFIIVLTLMISHWFLFNGCFLTFIIDKPILQLFGAADYLADHNFSDTLIYKLFIKYF